MCLLRALRELGVPVRPTGAGPSWALRDGNRFLREFTMHLRHFPGVPTEEGRTYTNTADAKLALSLLSRTADGMTVLNSRHV